VIALMYHDVVAPGFEDASGFPGRDASSYKVTVDRFRAHLEAILVRRPPAGLPVFTFDDGGAGASKAADMLEATGRRGYFFVTANYIGTRGFVGAAAIRDLDRRGHVIGSHSCSHPLRIGHCPPGQLRDEWNRSHHVISAILGRAITVASVPGGDFRPSVAEFASAAGFTDLFTSEPTTSSQKAFGLTLHGRFTIRSWTTARTAAALSAGDYLPCARQALVWKVKKLGKQLGGERYLRFRRLLLGDARRVQWGDCRD
jgi:peptidoglycan/xylan/chitin deacetylase (PgdA/CDA1 family)